MPRAVELNAYGDVDQLRIVDVAKPEPKAGEVLVRVVAAGTNPGEISIREGYLKEMFPMDFPFGQGTDFAGRVDAVGPGVSEFAPGDEVLGWTFQRAAQADYVVSGPANLIRKPVALDWFRAGSLFIVATTAVGRRGRATPHAIKAQLANLRAYRLADSAIDHVAVDVEWI